jgi:hypothetical protein
MMMIGRVVVVHPMAELRWFLQGSGVSRRLNGA